MKKILSTILVIAALLLSSSCADNEQLLVSVNPQQTVDQLIISSHIFHQGEPVKKGVIKLHITSYPSGATRSLIREFTNGEFVYQEPIGKAEKLKLLIRVEAMTKEYIGMQEAGLGVAQQGFVKLYWHYIFAFVIGVFFVLYTGPFTDGKRRFAFGTAYLVMALSVFLPIWGLISLANSDDINGAMTKSPINIIRVHSVGDDNKSGGIHLQLDQWALNIGGVLSEYKYEGHDLDDEQKQYNVAGGLVVPLYVMILAILGGVVNMTRELPRLQHDIKGDINSYFEKSGLLTVFRSCFKKTQTPAEIQSQEIVAEHVDDDKKLSPMEQRAQLIFQYMYLFTSPIVAVVAYYLLFMVEGKLAESVPIVVLISFASGLLSETVVRAIDHQANFYIDKLKSNIDAKKDKLNETK